MTTGCWIALMGFLEATPDGTPAADSSAPPPASEAAPAKPMTDPVSSPLGMPLNGPISAKADRLMFNLKFGPAVGVYQMPIFSGAVVLDFGIALRPGGRAYLIVPVQSFFSQQLGAFILPVGFEYDIRLPKKGLYLYPRMSVGYALFIRAVQSTSTLDGLTLLGHLGVIIPELGIKYVVKNRWNFGAELFSMPIFFSRYGVGVQYRLLLSGGGNF